MSQESGIGGPVISKYEGTERETAVYKNDIMSHHVTITTHEEADNQPGGLASVV